MTDVTRADIDAAVKRWRPRPVESRLLRDLFEVVAREIGCLGEVETVAQALAKRGVVAFYDSAIDRWILR